jgi:dsRNA-specific ribonuclease
MIVCVLQLPDYDATRVGGLAHSPIFQATVRSGTTIIASGVRGSSKKEAEEAAAEEALRFLARKYNLQ